MQIIESIIWPLLLQVPFFAMIKQMSRINKKTSKQIEEQEQENPSVFCESI
jgi:large-conductance mechanosensitive channel